MKEEIPKKYSWKVQTDTKNKVEKNKKERASGGLLLGLRKEIEEIKEERRMKAEEGRN